MSFLLLDIVEYGLWAITILMIPLGVHIFFIFRNELRRQREARMVDYTDSKWWP